MNVTLLLFGDLRLSTQTGIVAIVIRDPWEKLSMNIVLNVTDKGMGTLYMNHIILKRVTMPDSTTYTL